VVRALPVRPLPFPGGSFGSSLVLVAPGSDPGGTPLCRLPVSSKPFCPTTATARAMRVHLSWGFLPLQRSTKPGVRLSRQSPRPSGTVRPQGFSPSRRLLRLASCWAHQPNPSRDLPGLPAALLGFPVLRSLVMDLSIRNRALRKPVSSPRFSSSPRRARVGVLSLPALVSPRFTAALLRERSRCVFDRRFEVLIARKLALTQ